LKTYSDEFKNSIVVKLLPPNNASVPMLAKETGIPRDTLYGWRRQAGGQGNLPATPAAPVGALSSAEKFRKAGSGLGAPSEAWCFLPGASPGRERGRK
jgi:transposase-like protein